MDDDASLRGLAARIVRRRFPEASILEAGSAEDALLLMSGVGEGLVVVSDLDLGPGMDGAGLLALVKERHPRAHRILLTGAPVVPEGAHEIVVNKGVRFPGLIEAIAR